jgi:uncharacterized protein (TIGR03546 family)
MIRFIAKLISALNANSRAGEIGAAISCGVLLALIPGGNLLWIALFLIFYFTKLHIASMLFTILIVKGFAFLFDPFFHSVGERLLRASRLEPIWTYLYSMPIIPYTNFNDTLVMGAFATGLILWLPLFFLFTGLVKVYRRTVAPKIAESKLVKTFQKIPLVQKISTAAKKGSSAWEWFKA